MNSTLRSLDGLLNRFDELSQSHEHFLSDFDNNFSEIKNPLRSVARTEVERKKWAANILPDVNENEDQLEPTGSLEHFHRHVQKSRFLNRPPNYSSNDGLLTFGVSSKSSFTTPETISLSKILLTTNKDISSQPVISNSKNRIIQPKTNVSKKNEFKSSPRRHVRETITTFTLVTINRLSKPRRYNRLPATKFTQQPPKPAANRKKGMLKGLSTMPSVAPPAIKRTKITNNKSSPKKLKVENKSPVQTSKRNSVPVSPASTKHSNLPVQSQQKSSRIVNLPKETTVIKVSMIQSKT